MEIPPTISIPASAADPTKSAITPFVGATFVLPVQLLVAVELPVPDAAPPVVPDVAPPVVPDAAPPVVPAAPPVALAVPPAEVGSAFNQRRQRGAEAPH